MKGLDLVSSLADREKDELNSGDKRRDMRVHILSIVPHFGYRGDDECTSAHVEIINFEFNNRRFY